MSRRAAALLGAAIHLALLVFPLVCMGHARQIPGDAPTVLFLILTTALVIGEILAQHPESSAASDRSPTDQLLAGISALALLAIYEVGLIERAGQSLEMNLPTLAAGATLAALGVALRCVAIRELGRYFVTEARVAPDQPLITTGIYARARHPSETGLLAMGLGASILLQSFAALVLWALVLVPSSLARIRREDRILERAFPSHHRHYMQRVAALLPSIALASTRR